jgi:hypothetical protein
VGVGVGAADEVPDLVVSVLGPLRQGILDRRQVVGVVVLERCGVGVGVGDRGSIADGVVLDGRQVAEGCRRRMEAICRVVSERRRVVGRIGAGRRCPALDEVTIRPAASYVIAVTLPSGVVIRSRLPSAS